MKPKYLHIIIILNALLLFNCHDKVITDDMSDSTKLELLDRQIDKHKTDPDLRAQRASVLLNLGRPKEAQNDIIFAINKKPDELKYRMLQADICFANGNVGESYQALTEAERIDPRNNEVKLKMGEVTFYSRDYERSLKCLTKVTEKDPNNRTALFMKGFIYKEQGDTASAITLLRKVCDLYPNYEPAFEELGIIYSTRNNGMAEEYLHTALRIEPENTNAMYALAIFYQNTNQIEQAETLYHQMLDINPNSSDAWHNLGYIELFHYRDYELAIEFLTKAIIADPTNIAAIANRGCAYELNGMMKEAKIDFESALMQDSQYHPAIEGLKRIK